MSDPLLIITSFLLISTMFVAIIYYRLIQRSQEEYKDAKGVVNNIIISFNKQLERQENKLNVVAQKMLVLSSKKKDAYTHEMQLQIDNRVSEIEERVLEHFNRFDKKIDEVAKLHDSMEEKIEEFKQKIKTPKAEIEAVIPIKKEKILAPLTETELNVLRALAIEGELTAPEIRNKIKLSREHTSRLMKKLYDNGYLERNTRKIPYTYHLKKEMQGILQKSGI